MPSLGFAPLDAFLAFEDFDPSSEGFLFFDTGVPEDSSLSLVFVAFSFRDFWID
jgi:hypothetical protein